MKSKHKNFTVNFSHYSKYTLFVLVLSIFALGAMVASSNANTQAEQFKIADAVTKSADGKTITAKQGFELVRKGENGIVARKKDATTSVSTDTITCFCQEFPKCSERKRSPCCNHPVGTQMGRDISCNVSSDNVSTASCKGNCDQCKFE